MSAAERGRRMFFCASRVLCIFQWCKSNAWRPAGECRNVGSGRWPNVGNGGIIAAREGLACAYWMFVAYGGGGQRRVSTQTLAYDDASRCKQAPHLLMALATTTMQIADLSEIASCHGDGGCWPNGRNGREPTVGRRAETGGERERSPRNTYPTKSSFWENTAARSSKRSRITSIGSRRSSQGEIALRSLDLNSPRVPPYETHGAQRAS